MSFLSIEQRKAAATQLRRHIAALDADIWALTGKACDLLQYRELQKACLEQVEKACNGELEADEQLAVEAVSRERLAFGINHYPVSIQSGAKVVILGGLK